MALVNIGQDNKDDGFYRYKMPKLITKIEGRGNGIKTNVVNMVDVAKALARPPSYTTKYFGCVLGAQSKFDAKTGTSTVNGAHDTTKLVQLLEGFIKKYVQCYGCGNPETEVIITKNQCITLKCAACGFVSDVDMRDKLTTFILNNPPEVKKKGSKTMRRAEKERLKAGEALDEEKKSKVKKSKDGEKSSTKKSSKKKTEDEEKVESPASSNKDEEEDDDDDVEWQTDTSAEAAKQRIKEQLSAVTAEMVMVSTDDKEVKSPHLNGMSPQQNGHVSKTNEKLEEEPLDPHQTLVSELSDYIKTHKLAEVANHVLKMTVTKELLAALVEAMMHGISKGFAKEFMKKKAVFAAIVNEDEEMQKQLLCALEFFFAVKAGESSKEIALILKALYDEDILEEDVILEWHENGTNDMLDKEQAASARKLAEPFVKWLKEAEADEEDDDE
ncbi:hypothetical protein CLOM_g11032 [Closterium sp. NIES-68]|nr:hypothetical protein CLOM_g11032 [Closterium sp. NIES-68]GJP59124.1 hypothetical protein CLOP_g8325 [Closterium sp. NIES-67]